VLTITDPHLQQIMQFLATTDPSAATNGRCSCRLDAGCAADDHPGADLPTFIINGVRIAGMK